MGEKSVFGSTWLGKHRTGQGSGDRPRRPRGWLSLVVLTAVSLIAALAPTITAATAGAAAAFTPASQVQFTLEGCRNPADGSLVLPNADGKYICGDSLYTTGNLGKGWNELDLVPHRLITNVGTQVGATTDYNVIVGADNQTAGHLGYDVVSVPEVNTAKSDASCTVSAGPQSTTGSVTGGADQVIYRDLTIHQAKGSTCVLDYYERLALGSHLYPGSSLQSYMFESENFQTGKRTISLPVNQILPQALSKDMAATQDADHIWSVTKSPTPATINFENTCAVDAALSAPVQITVSWEKLPADPSGSISVITHVYATNPASRVITVNVTDKIYAGLTEIDSASSGAVDVSANTTQLLLTHQTTAPAGSTNLNDVATATYTDKVTGIAVPGDTTATASATVQPSGVTLNNTAVISDVESITGTGLTFSVAGTSGASGTFGGGYTLGTKTTGPVSWTSATQSDSGSVTFDKTIFVDQPRITNGSLSDTATLNGSDGFTTSANASVAISSSASVALTIDKTIPDVLQGSETATFGFAVYRTADLGQPNPIPVATPSIGFAAGDTSKSTTVTGLAPGAYTVKEVSVPSGWSAQPDQATTIALPTCAGSVSFANTFPPAGATVQKITIPAGGEAGWTFSLHQGDATGPVLATATTTGTGPVPFGYALTEGSYTITETSPPAGVPADKYEPGQPSASCSFTVDFVQDAGHTFSCTFTNVQRATARVKKVTVPSGNEAGWTFDLRDSGNNVIATATTTGTGYIDFGVYLTSGDYTITEQGRAGFDQTGSSGDCTFTVSLPQDAARVFSCTYTNTQRGRLEVTKNVNWNGVTPVDGQSFLICVTGPSFPAPTADNGGCQTATYPNNLVVSWEDLVPGDYSVVESDPGSLWVVSGDTTATVPPGGTGTATVVNTRQLGGLAITKQVVWNGVTPVDGQSFLICVTGPSFPAPTADNGGCQTATYPAGLTLSWSNLIPGSYTLSEPGLSTQWTVTGDTTATVPDDGGTGTATVINTHNPPVVPPAEVLAAVVASPTFTG